MKELLKKYNKIEPAYAEYERLTDLFIKQNKRKPSTELWFSFTWEMNKQAIGLVCYYDENNKTELEFYKNNI